ncbi:MAG: filamentous hemagglutinin N-terminal domain-containing protein, partial [Verrucomicrobiae bacterium]|nr:filamentous hemagglutinin N-terminal domain-containing protein [Verrucomicrobiae bacterium]
MRHGSAAFNRDVPGQLLIEQFSDKAIIDWQSFSIEAGELTQFLQPSSSSAVLNRVVSGNLSAIHGTLSANGKVLLVNPNGILVGPGGVIDTAGFIASTLDVSDADFLGGGDMIFSGGSEAKVVNLGSISAREGDLFLIAKEVVNEGALSAPNGNVGLAGGNEVRIAASGDERVFVRPGGEGSVTNTGTITGVVAELKAAGGNRMALAVNNEGTVRATGVGTRNGQIYLTAGGGDITNTGALKASNADGSGGQIKVENTGPGDINNEGDIDASGSVGNGGEVAIIAAEGSINTSGEIDASGAEDGGLVMMDASEGTVIVDGGVDVSGSSGAGGQAIITGQDVMVGVNGTIDASGGTDGGVVILDATEGATTINGAVNATGGTGVGGQVIATGSEVNLGSTASVDVSGGAGGGMALIGGSYQGSTDPDVQNAVNTTVAEGAKIAADALNSGNAGTVVVWSDDTTDFQGEIFARSLGRDAPGDGGTAEVSGKINLTFAGPVDLRSFNGGNYGSLLLDPGGVDISTAATGINVINDGDLSTQLGLSSVTIFASNGGVSTVTPNPVNGNAFLSAAGTGDIDFLAGTRVIWSNGTTAAGDALTKLELRADGDINALDDVIVRHASTSVSDQDGDNADGDTFVINSPNVDAITFMAAGDINIGSVAGRTDDVRVGSEFFGTTLVAGDTNFDGTVDAAGSISVIGGDVSGTTAQVGFAAGSARGNNTGQDYVNDDGTGNDHARNGTITLAAGGDILIQGGANGASFAQVGHGGAGFVTASGSDIVNATINVTTTMEGDVILRGPDEIAGTSGLDNDRTYAQIGHGYYKVASSVGTTTASVGNISGNVIVTSSGDVLLNQAINLDGANEGDHDYFVTQIGHGSHYYYDGTGDSGTVVSDGKKAGAITVTADGDVMVGSALDIGMNDDRVTELSQIGHGSLTRFNYNSAATTADNDYSVRYGRITSFNDLSGAELGTNISVTGASITLDGSIQDDSDDSAHDDEVVDNLNRAVIGHGAFTRTAQVGDPDLAAGSTNAIDISVSEGDISGDITLTDTTADGGGSGITIQSDISTGDDNATSDDAGIARVGHGSGSFLDSLNGSDGVRGGNILVTQGHILGATISLSTSGVEADDQDITISSSVESGLSATRDSVALAQVGHGGDIFAATGNGGDAVAGQDAPRAGDIGIYEGTVWDGYNHYDAGTAPDQEPEHVAVGGSTAIDVNSSNQIVLSSVTDSALAVDERNISFSEIGHGHFFTLRTGDGGSSDATNGAAGGRGGDVDIRSTGGDTPNLRERYRDIDGDYSATSDNVQDFGVDGLRGGISLNAVSTAAGESAITITSDNTAGLAANRDNTAVSQVGSGHYMEVFTGDGGNGGDDNGEDGDAAYGNRGGDAVIYVGKIESDITVGTSVDPVTGQILVEATNVSGLAASERNIADAQIGHGQRIYVHAGDGGDGGVADGTLGDGLANEIPIQVANANSEIFTLQNDIIGAVRGGRGGDVFIDIGDITDRRTEPDGLGGFIVFHDDYADVSVNAINGDATNPNDLTVNATISGGLANSVEDNSWAGVGHHIRLGAIGGIGGEGGRTSTEHDAFIQPDATGGRGGDVQVRGGNIIGDITTDTERQTSITTSVAESTDGVVFAQIGHSTQLLAITQNGGDAGDLFDASTAGPNTAANDGGIDAQDSGYDLFLLDRNDDDTVDLVDDGDTANGGLDDNGYIDDGVALKADDEENDGEDSAVLVRLTLGNLNVDDGGNGTSGSGIDTNTDDNVDAGGAAVAANEDLLQSGIDPDLTVSGSAQASGTTNLVDTIGVADNYAMINDGEGDPQFILVDTGLDGGGAASGLYVWVPNVTETDPDGNGLSTAEVNRNTALASARTDAANNGLGRTVGAYETNAYTVGLNTFEQFELTGGGDGVVESGNFLVQGDYDAAVHQTLGGRDFVYVDLNEDGLSDLVDFDANGAFDLVDIDRDGIYDKIDGNSGVTELADGVIDFPSLTGVAYSASHTEGGWELADFSTANGGRGGDASIWTGFTVGDITVRTGDPVVDSPDSLIVRSDLGNGQSGGAGDFLTARIGHGAYDVADADGTLTGLIAGRMDTAYDAAREQSQEDSKSADGGDAGFYAVNGNGGRGGDASVSQGASRLVRDDDELTVGVDETVHEMDHLVGAIRINPDDVTGTGFPDTKRLVVEALNGKGLAGNDEGVSVAQIGHGSTAYATAANLGGDGASHGNDSGPEDSTSQTETANGGRGGDSAITMHQVKGTIDVRAGRDDAPTGDGDFSIEVTATNAPDSGADNENIVIGQIGHGRLAIATSGDGGDADDGQRWANGGRGGDVLITQNAIIDTGIDVNTTTYDGNGLKIESTEDSGANNVVRSLIGNGDLAYAGTLTPKGDVVGGLGGDGANGDADPNPEAVVEQFNQVSNGGRGGDRVIDQAAYNYDIQVDVGPNQSGGEDAIVIQSTAVNETSKAQNHILAAIGHGGYGLAVSNAGGESGQGADIDFSLTPGTTRNGGRGGHAVSNIGTDNSDIFGFAAGGTGVAITGREDFLGRIGLSHISGNGINDAFGLDSNLNRNDGDGLGTGADIVVRAFDDRDSADDNDLLGDVNASAMDGILIQSNSGPQDNEERAIDVNMAVIGHHAFNKADADAADGEQSIRDSDLTSSVHTQGNGGDGGDAWASTGSVKGEIIVANALDLDGDGVYETASEDTNFNGVLDVGEDLDGDGRLDRGLESALTLVDNNGDDLDTDIKVRSIQAGLDDGATHQAEARIGHFASNEAMARNEGGWALNDATGTDAYNATISANAGDGGDAMAIQGSLRGDITAVAENSVIVEVTKSGLAATPENFAQIGHRLENDVRAGMGGRSSGNVLDTGIGHGMTNVKVL